MKEWMILQSGFLVNTRHLSMIGPYTEGTGRKSYRAYFVGEDDAGIELQENDFKILQLMLLNQERP